MPAGKNGRGFVMNQRKDKYWTPKWAIENIIPIIPKDVKVIWECACGDKWISKVLEENGYKVISTDIDTGLDFLTNEIKEDYDLILTNPPFSLKSNFLSRCYELNKPFLLLCPITILESKKRLKLYKENGVSFFMPPNRVNFISSYEEDKDKKSSAPFFSIWVGKLPNYKSFTFNLL